MSRRQAEGLIGDWVGVIDAAGQARFAKISWHDEEGLSGSLDLPGELTFRQPLRDIDLRRQLLRAIRSIAANLAEGAGSDSQAVFARHIAIALGSAEESECHLRIARDAGLMDAPIHANLQLALDNLRPRLIRLLLAVRQNARRRSD